MSTEPLNLDNVIDAAMRTPPIRLNADVRNAVIKTTMSRLATADAVELADGSVFVRRSPPAQRDSTSSAEPQSDSLVVEHAQRQQSQEIMDAIPEISVKPTADPDYPGVVISLGNEELVLFERQPTGTYVVRVWEHEGQDPIYAHTYSADRKEESSDESRHEGSA